MKKRLMSLLLGCSMILSLFTGLSVTALAANSDFDIDGTELYQYTGTDTDVVVPDGITRIDEGAFAYNEFIESVTIPASVATIAECKETIKSSVGIPALGHNVVDGKCTREGCNYTEPAQENLFQKFFEGKEADMTAVNSTDKAWTGVQIGTSSKYKLKASGSEEKVFTLTMKKDG